MKLTNVYHQPSVSPHVRRFEFTNIKSKYRDAYYISIEGSELQLGSQLKGWHKDWFMKWNITKRE